jgi:hypothetical protein
MNVTLKKGGCGGGDVALPARVDAAFLSKHLRVHEPVVVVQAAGIGVTAPYEYRGLTRAYVLRWDLRRNAHVLRVPLHLWRQREHALAHDLLGADDRPVPLVVLVEMPEATAAEARLRLWHITRSAGPNLAKTDVVILRRRETVHVPELAPGNWEGEDIRIAEDSAGIQRA